MRLKPGVRLVGLQPQIVLAMLVTEGVYWELGHEFVVTSCNDSKHGDKSLHYEGRAFDARSKHVPVDHKQLLLDRLREQLGADFDVLMEFVGKDNEHLHVEYDPK